MNFIGQILFLMLGVVISLQAVPPVLNYAGQVAVNGQPFEGEGLFKFALVNANGNITYWSNDGKSVNGSEPQASVKVPVSGGLYSLLLGNTAIPGMGAINPQVFAQHTDAKLRVWFSDGVNGFQQLSPDRPFASVPYAFSAGTTTIADGSISKSMLGSDVLTDLNAPIGLNRLSSEVTAKLDQNGSGGSGVVAGSLISVPHGQSALAGYSLYQQGTPKELVWEEKAPVSVARNAYDGVESLGGKIYFVGGHDGSAKDIAERFDPVSNQWETLAPMSSAREAAAAAVLNGKLYLIGGRDGSGNVLSSVEIYDPSNGTWAAGPSLPAPVWLSRATVVSDNVYLVGGKNSSGVMINQLLCLNSQTNQWTTLANMSTSRDGMLVLAFNGKIWAIGGWTGADSKKVESYDPVTDTWQTEASLANARNWATGWVSHGEILVAGGYGTSSNGIEKYNPITQAWTSFGLLPVSNIQGDATVLNNWVYLMGGNDNGTHSNKVFAADLNASVDGVYDLYRKDGNASAGTPLVQAEVADGSVTASKMAEGAVSKSALDVTILKYLKPEITAQPQAQTVYADTNVSYSVTAEGKYLTYQWKKNGSDLTGENNATLTIIDANATLHDGNYTVVVSNDFGSVKSGEILVDVNTTWSTDGLVGWWPLDGNASDMSGNGNDGVVYGAILTSDRNGLLNKAYSFNGTNSYIQIPYKSSLNAVPITYSIWCSANVLNSLHGSPLTSRYTSPSSGISIYKSPENTWYLMTGISGNEWSSVPTNVSVELNQWVKLLVSINATEAIFYVNGNPSQTINNFVANTSGSLRIGAGATETSSPQFFFKGLIDDLRIYDRALSAAEVQALYNLGQ